MKWGFRWYGEKDSIPLHHFRQIPGTDGVVGTLLGNYLVKFGKRKKLKSLNLLLKKKD